MVGHGGDRISPVKYHLEPSVAHRHPIINDSSSSAAFGIASAHHRVSNGESIDIAVEVLSARRAGIRHVATAHNARRAATFSDRDVDWLFQPG